MRYCKINMRYCGIKKISVCLLIIMMTGCASKVKPPPYSADSKEHSFTKKVAEESERLAATQKELRESVEKRPQKEIDIKPIVPEYDPLEDHIISLSMIDEDMQFALYSISKEVGINLIIDPAVSKEKKLITINFENASASVVLREILKTFDLYYTINHNMIMVKPFEERVFKLNFLDTNIKATFNVGGDVLGGGGDAGTTGLTGSFAIAGSSAAQGNPYDVLESVMAKTISPNGKYSINRISGTLYLKDTPAVIKSVSKLVNHLTEMLSRQILIEARIVEVSLTDNYKYGIDWALLRNETASGTRSEVKDASWALGRGMILSGLAGSPGAEFTVNATIDALKTFGVTKIVSNPSIRSKHAQPASISVGTSFSYKKSVKTTSNTGTTGLTTGTTTEVEVSTVFDGLILGVIPFIGEDGHITLLINPIKSDVDRESLALENVGDGQSITLPKVSVKEISTTISLNSGDVVILGGLIDRKELKGTKGVPFLSSIPILGALFRNDSKTEETSELVIILSVSLV